MDPNTVVVPPPAGNLSDYPIAITVVLGSIATAFLIIIVKKFDATGGPLTLSILIILTFMGALAFGMRFTIPQDPETAALVGGLVASFGAVMTYWANRIK